MFKNSYTNELKWYEEKINDEIIICQNQLNNKSLNN